MPFLSQFLVDPELIALLPLPASPMEVRLSNFVVLPPNQSDHYHPTSDYVRSTFIHALLQPLVITNPVQVNAARSLLQRQLRLNPVSSVLVAHRSRPHRVVLGLLKNELDVAWLTGPVIGSAGSIEIDVHTQSSAPVMFALTTQEMIWFVIAFIYDSSFHSNDKTVELHRAHHHEGKLEQYAFILSHVYMLMLHDFLPLISWLPHTFVNRMFRSSDRSSSFKFYPLVDHMAVTSLIRAGHLKRRDLILPKHMADHFDPNSFGYRMFILLCTLSADEHRDDSHHPATSEVTYTRVRNLLRSFDTWVVLNHAHIGPSQRSALNPMNISKKADGTIDLMMRVQALHGRMLRVMTILQTISAQEVSNEFYLHLYMFARYEFDSSWVKALGGFGQVGDDNLASLSAFGRLTMVQPDIMSTGGFTVKLTHDRDIDALYAQLRNELIHDCLHTSDMRNTYLPTRNVSITSIDTVAAFSLAEEPLVFIFPGVSVHELTSGMHFLKPVVDLLVKRPSLASLFAHTSVTPTVIACVDSQLKRPSCAVVMTPTVMGVIGYAARIQDARMRMNANKDSATVVLTDVLETLAASIPFVGYFGAWVLLRAFMAKQPTWIDTNNNNKKKSVLDNLQPSRPIVVRHLSVLMFVATMVDLCNTEQLRAIGTVVDECDMPIKTLRTLADMIHLISNGTEAGENRLKGILDHVDLRVKTTLVDSPVSQQSAMSCMLCIKAILAAECGNTRQETVRLPLIVLENRAHLQHVPSISEVDARRITLQPDSRARQMGAQLTTHYKGFVRLASLLLGVKWDPLWCGWNLYNPLAGSPLPWPSSSYYTEMPVFFNHYSHPLVSRETIVLMQSPLPECFRHVDTARHITKKFVPFIEELHTNEIGREADRVRELRRQQQQQQSSNEDEMRDDSHELRREAEELEQHWSPHDPYGTNATDNNDNNDNNNNDGEGGGGGNSPIYSPTSPRYAPHDPSTEMTEYKNDPSSSPTWNGGHNGIGYIPSDAALASAAATSDPTMMHLDH